MLEGNYNHQEVEQKWQKLWASSSLYNWDESEERENSYVIDTPPPTVSGLLHMGHIFSYTQTDFIARFKRMVGMNVFYPIGYDDNGLATERLVEKLKGIKAGQMHREEFRKICEQVVVEAENEFEGLFREIALSVDWRQQYRTVGADVIRISQMSFIDLYKQGFAERRLAPTFWDVVDRTAIAQAEIEDKEKQGVMWDVAFGVSSGSNVTIATTRPEMLGACVAVFYHPDDKRYGHLNGLSAVTPLYGASVPFLADSDVDMEKGSGLVMCCTFGDAQDIVWWRRHNLVIKQVIGADGRMMNASTDSVALDGCTIFEAKRLVVEGLKASGALLGEKAVVQHVKCAERSGAALEIISTNQWYVKLLDKKDALLQKGRQCQWNPEYMRVRYENWVEGLNQDWCISRQRYFGVPFPVWYSKRSGEEGKVLLADLDQLPCDPTLALPKGYRADEVVAETDVMDTWATSGLTPQINAHGIKDGYMVNAKRHAKLYPADLRPQAHEIIRTWSFYTIAKSLLHADSIPWKALMISGWCLAADKTKMSKSKGNVVTPKELVISKGADAVRYWASHSKLGVDIAYSEDVFKNGNRLVNKLWNASKFLSIHIRNINGSPSTPVADVASGKIFEDADMWILAKLRKTIEQATAAFEAFDYADARSFIEDFFWKDLCDNYLELVKARLYNETEEGLSSKQSAVWALWHVFRALYRLFAPFVPYITEELNASMFGSESVHARGVWPKVVDHYEDADIVAIGTSALAILELVRKYKSVNSLSLKAELVEVWYSASEALPASIVGDLRNAANAQTVVYKHELERVDVASEGGGYGISVV